MLIRALIRSMLVCISFVQLNGLAQDTGEVPFAWDEPGITIRISAVAKARNLLRKK
jgi:hypothetical protein